MTSNYWPRALLQCTVTLLLAVIWPTPQASLPDALVVCHLQLVLKVDLTGREEGVYAVQWRRFDRLVAAEDVFLSSSRQP